MPAADARNGATAAAEAAVHRLSPKSRPLQYTASGHSASNRYSDQRNTVPGSTAVPMTPESMEGRLW